jgi:filamentous hemagglutinin family protein
MRTERGLACFWVGVLGWLTLGNVPLLAQSVIVPDETLGSERSRVTPETIRGVESDRIEGGARRGGNLFHSFGQFDIQDGRGAYFNNPTGVENVFGRVTGNVPSNIQGTLGVIQEGSTEVLGNANLFLINPNGIVFGAGARLDLGGSFVGTTADGVGFGDRGVFGTLSPDVPSQLLTVNPSALLFRSQQPTVGQITVQGNGQGARTTTSPIDTQDALRIPGDRTLALIGGSLTMEGATLKTAGGRIELGSVAALGSVAIIPVSEGWTFNYDGVQSFQDIRLSQQSTVDASGLGGGDIQARGRNIVLTESSQIEASTLGAEPGGRVDLTASESVDVRGVATDPYYSGVFAQAYSGSTGNGGNIFITGNRVNVMSLAKVDTSTGGSGQAGDLTINANESVDFSGLATDPYYGGAFAQAYSGSTGDGGNIFITANHVSVMGAARIDTSTNSSGRAGDLRINANELVEVVGSNQPGSVTSIRADVDSNVNAQAGNIAINTARLSVRGAEISTTVNGSGTAGNLTVNASDSVELMGETPSGNNVRGEEVRGYPGGLFALVDNDAIGVGGTLTIATGRLRISDGSKAQAISFGTGDSGNVSISADSVEVFETAQPNYFNTGIFVGNGFDPQGDSDVTQGGRGNLTIRANRMSVHGGEISAGTQGQGDAGGILIQARDLVEVVDTSEATGKISLIGATVSEDATGRGGDVRIETDRLVVRGGQIATSTSGKGDAGNLTISALDSITLIGEAPGIDGSLGTIGGLFARVKPTGSGRGGNITINTGELGLDDRSRITASTQGQGRSGNVSIASDHISISDGGRILTSTSSANRRSRAGDITIQNTGDVNLNGHRSRIFTGTELNTSANGGNVELATDGLNISDRARISAQSNGTGRAGDITINASGQTQLTNGNIITAATQSSGGGIQINGDDPILLEGSSQITTDSRGNGGNISLDAPGIVAFDTSDILARSEDERGGRIQLAPFFGEGYQPNAPFEGDRININASGGVEDGEIQTPDTSFVQNSLANISEVPINTDRLLANSCIVRDRQQGRFTITGSGGLPDRPGNANQSAYPTGTIQPIPEAGSRSDRPWQMGDAIVEPQGVYRLTDGRLVMSDQCSEHP